MFFLSHYVQAVNNVVQCFKVRLGSLDKKKVFLQKGTSMGSAQHPAQGDAPARAARNTEALPLRLYSWSRARAEDIWGLDSTGLRFCT